MGETKVTKNFYQQIHNGVSARPWLKAAVTASAKLLPGLVYLSYPLLLLYLLIWNRAVLLRSVLVPAAGFLIVTVLRAAINAPRPYEALGIPAVTHKDTQGKSFPSRHAACGAVIAVTALYALPPLGWALLAVSLLIALSRVLSGVHFVKDVLAGWLLGAMIGCIGFLI